MWSRVQIAALAALLAASPSPTEPRPSPVHQPHPRFCSRMSASSTARAPRFPHLRMCWCAATRSRKSRPSLFPSTMPTSPRSTVDGRTLMPGLIDAHWHAMLARPNPVVALSSDIGYLNLLAGAEATATLMRGFTTIRDMGGPVFGLKRAIDEGLLPGPRIYPSGAVITITGGHGDFRAFPTCRGRPERCPASSRWAQPPSPTVRMRFGCAHASS